MGISGGSKTFVNRVDTFTALGNGQTVDISTNPLSRFTISVKTTGVITAWSVILEGSVDGTNFTTIARHTNVEGGGAAVFSGTNYSHCTHFRSRCVSITLGIGTNIIVTVLGAQ